MLDRMAVLSTGGTRSEESEDLGGCPSIATQSPTLSLATSPQLGCWLNWVSRPQEPRSYIIGGFSNRVAVLPGRFEKAESCDDFASTIHGG